MHRDLEAFIQKRHLAEACRERVVIVHRGFREDFRVRPERDLRSRVVRCSNLMELRLRVTVVKIDLVFFAVAPHIDLNARGERINDGHADAVQTTRDLIPLAAELAASMENRQNDLNRRNLLLRMHVYRDTAAVVGYRDRVIGMNPYLDRVAIAGKRFVDGVVDNLVHQMMQAARARRADIHTRPLAHRFETFEDLNVRTIVVIGFVNH